MSGFVVHPEAIADLEEIWDFIAVDSWQAADRVLDEIHKAIKRLATFPEMGHVRADLSSKALRFHPVGDYLIAYAPDENPLMVIAVLHGRRNPRVIAAFLRGRK